MCVDVAAPGEGARTLIVPMARVADGLTPAQLEILRLTSYARPDGAPAIARGDARHVTFSFRDFLDAPLDWRSSSSAPAQEVNAAIRALLANLYGPGALAAAWRRGRLVALDNTQVFHGRTAESAKTAAGRRHLRRLRLR